MERIVAKINSDVRIVFDAGKFDSWCVYIIEKDKKYAPRDVEYFSEIQQIAKEYPAKKTYHDFLKFYTHTTSKINPVVIDFIKEITLSYERKHQFIMLKWFVVIYAGMIAEENKENAILKKRIKHLGVYQLLIEGMEAEKAANFSRGKGWKELDLLMKKRGI